MAHRNGDPTPSEEPAAEQKANTTNSPDQSKGYPTGHFSRRSYLKFAAGAAAALGAGAGTASAATTRYGISFNEVVDAVADLGMDPNGNSSISNQLENAARDNRLITFPDGDFFLNSDVSIGGKSNFGIVGSGNTTFHAPSSTKINIVLRNADNNLFADLTLDQSATSSSFATKFLTPTYSHIENIDVVGFNEPMDGVNIGFKIVPYATEPDAEIVVKNFNAVDGGRLGDYIGGGGGMYVGPGHYGTVQIIDCHLEEWANNGIYAGRANGPVQVIGGVYRNNDVSQVRLSGPDSYVKGAKVEVDMSKSDNPGTPKGQRGVQIETGKIQKTGGGIYDCDIKFNDAPNAGNAILVHGNAGYAVVENTRIEVNRDGARALRAVEPQATNGGSRPPAPEPHYIKMRGVSITGSASGNEAVVIDNRPNTEVVNSCLHQTGSNRDGVKLVDCASSKVSDDTIDVSDRTTVFVRSDVQSSNVTTDGTCPVPDFSDSTSDTSDSTNDTSDSTNDTTDTTNTDPLTVEKAVDDGSKVTYSLTVDGDLVETSTVDDHETFTSDGVEGVLYSGVDEFGLDGSLVDVESDGEIVVTLDGQQVDLSQLDTSRLVIEPASSDNSTEINYSFTVDGSISTTDTVDAHEEVTDTSATGIIIGGTDEYDISGSLTDFQTDGDLTVTLDGQAVDLSQFSSEPTWHDLHIEGNSDSKINYSFSVDGDLEATETVDGHEKIDGSSVEGVMRSGVDDFRFTGSLTDFQANGDLTVTVDGEAVDLSQFSSEPTWKELHIEGNSRSKINYSFSVDGDLEATETVDGHEKIDGSSVEGVMRSGVDDFRFTGSLTDFQADGDLTVTVDGEAIDISQFAYDLPNTIVIDGSNSSGDSTYTFSVSGSIEKSAELGSVNSGDTIDGSTVSGYVSGGKDGYRFDGDITSFDLDGTAEVNLSDNDG